MTASPSLRPGTSIADPDAPSHALKPNADGSINISGSLVVDPTNLALEATQVAIRTAIGSVGDAAWSGTGNGSVIAILKAIAANTAA